jgi:hypothetical protein
VKPPSKYLANIKEDNKSLGVLSHLKDNYYTGSPITKSIHIHLDTPSLPSFLSSHPLICLSLPSHFMGFHGLSLALIYNCVHGSSIKFPDDDYTKYDI